jgi:hypothetical protein
MKVDAMRIERMPRQSIAILMLLLLSACTMTQETPSSSTTSNLQTVADRNLHIVTGQTIYVPAYSEIFFGSSNQTMELTVTLAIHNTDLDMPIIIQSVRYFDTDGALVQDYVAEAVELAPLATIGFVIPDSDTKGGWGANFIVEWGAEQAVYEPIIEALMVSSQGTHGISMISEGRILSETLPAED